VAFVSIAGNAERGPTYLRPRHHIVANRGPATSASPVA
jgi:hypothetical protein